MSFPYLVYERKTQGSILPWFCRQRLQHEAHPQSLFKVRDLALPQGSTEEELLICKFVSFFFLLNNYMEVEFSAGNEINQQGFLFLCAFRKCLSH